MIKVLILATLMGLASVHGDQGQQQNFVDQFKAAALNAIQDRVKEAVSGQIQQSKSSEGQGFDLGNYAKGALGQALLSKLDVNNANIMENSGNNNQLALPANQVGDFLKDVLGSAVQGQVQQGQEVNEQPANGGKKLNWRQRLRQAVGQRAMGMIKGLDIPHKMQQVLGAGNLPEQLTNLVIDQIPGPLRPLIKLALKTAKNHHGDSLNKIGDQMKAAAMGAIQDKARDFATGQLQQNLAIEGQKFDFGQFAKGAISQSVIDQKLVQLAEQLNQVNNADDNDDDDDGEEDDDDDHNEDQSNNRSVRPAASKSSPQYVEVAAESSPRVAEVSSKSLVAPKLDFGNFLQNAIGNSVLGKQEAGEAGVKLNLVDRIKDAAGGKVKEMLKGIDLPQKLNEVFQNLHLEEKFNQFLSGQLAGHVRPVISLGVVLV